MKVWRSLVLATAGLLVAPIARSGHEQSVYPSYYPHEIAIAAVGPEHALERMRAGRLHAYIGGAPHFAAAAADGIGTVASLGSFVMLKLNPDALLTKDEASACAVAAGILRGMAARGAGLMVHPYPVTPFHGDYLHHADRAEAARRRFLLGPQPPDDLKVRVTGRLAPSLVRGDWLSDGASWDAAIEEVSAAHLVADDMVALNGWLGPPWVRTGWYQAWRLLGASMEGGGPNQGLPVLVEQLKNEPLERSAERINQERELVRVLASGCKTMVAGYTVKREFFNADASAGVENLSFDALEGLSSPMFLRTVKLKDFPWNGWLQLGLPEGPAAAWNPIGGFTDAFGRLMWFAVGDAAMMPSPYDAGWALNRISDVEASPSR